ncbi:MAG TPA: carboxymuconolactone decarboxylase family protein [Anaerolineae bacterium]|jgi:alkylhydroperoxidase/carboxymuconolactone decarboxylase family protein YurZ|nr:carboxymuconolactone decarboxylase family protein [Anaerolineae bacterium]
MRSRKEIFDEMESMLGRVPSWMLILPDSTLEHDWEIFKAMELNESNLSPMQKHLMGVTVASAQGSPHMAYWHGQMAMAMGATDTQVDEAYQIARYASGWSATLEGQNPEMDFFKNETKQITEHIRQSMKKAA